MPPQHLYDLGEIDLDRTLFGLDEIRKYNPQRFEMEQLTAIVHIDRDQHGLVGYKDVTDDEFWVRGHMPGFPLMPGILICETAAQLAGFYSRKYDILSAEFLGFGGIDDVRFRAPVRPGDRLVLMARLLKVRLGRRAEFAFQAFVEETMVASGTVIGVPLNK